MKKEILSVINKSLHKTSNKFNKLIGFLEKNLELEKICSRFDKRYIDGQAIEERIYLIYPQKVVLEYHFSDILQIKYAPLIKPHSSGSEFYASLTLYGEPKDIEEVEKEILKLEEQINQQEKFDEVKLQVTHSS